MYDPYWIIALCYLQFTSIIYNVQFNIFNTQNTTLTFFKTINIYNTIKIFVLNYFHFQQIFISSYTFLYCPRVSTLQNPPKENLPKLPCKYCHLLGHGSQPRSATIETAPLLFCGGGSLLNYLKLDAWCLDGRRNLCWAHSDRSYNETLE